MSNTVFIRLLKKQKTLTERYFSAMEALMGEAFEAQAQRLITADQEEHLGANLEAAHTLKNYVMEDKQ